MSQAHSMEGKRHKIFFQKMAHPSATDLVKNIKRFVALFNAKAVVTEGDQDVTTIRDFLNHTEEVICKHPLWRGASDEELDDMREGLEKYILTKLYTKLFRSREKEVEIDEKIVDRLDRMAFMSFKHMDISEDLYNPSAMALAVSELRKINNYKVPRDKLICILNCCRVVYRMLSSGQESGADDFLPVLLIVVIRASPAHLHSNTQYIRRYRNPSKLIEEPGYYLTQLESAVHFLLNVSARGLSHVSQPQLDLILSGEIDIPEQATEEGERVVETRGERTEAKNTKQSTTPPTKGGGEDQEESGAGTQLTLEALLKECDMEKYSFHSRKAEDLRIGEVALLLEQYRSMARQNELLKKVLLHHELADGLSNPASGTHLDLAQARALDAGAESGDEEAAHEELLPEQVDKAFLASAHCTPPRSDSRHRTRTRSTLH